MNRRAFAKLLALLPFGAKLPLPTETVRLQELVYGYSPVRWVCEKHPDKPWPHDNCGGAGMPARQVRSRIVPHPCPGQPLPIKRLV